jgi:hypothetical protein
MAFRSRDCSIVRPGAGCFLDSTNAAPVAERGMAVSVLRNHVGVAAHFRTRVSGAHRFNTYVDR